MCQIKISTPIHVECDDIYIDQRFVVNNSGISYSFEQYYNGNPACKKLVQGCNMLV